MKPSADQEAVPGDAAVPTLASSVYERLRDDILRGQLAPGGKLRIEFVSERYDAGNSPVREALNRLSSDGLVDRRDQRGFYVAAASVADLLELTRTRCWLEEIGLRESIRAFTPGWEEGMVLALHRLGRVPRSISPDTYQENPEWERLHRAFHRSLIAGCGSRWLTGFCDQLADQAYRYRQLSVQKVYPKRKENDEHQAIVNAIFERNADLAVALLNEHYRKTADIIVESGEAVAKDALARATPPAANGSKRGR
ncbi:MAG: GntR family transcriptional regulator [Rhizobacter sp.]|nr:GntR family transcriptional regulator [Burkholderiaceae bacterium]MCO5123515.1 GntR family transcriptional regulator [Rhizobacter sp.]